jgi:hypothetical protein
VVTVGELLLCVAVVPGVVFICVVNVLVCENGVGECVHVCGWEFTDRASLVSISSFSRTDNNKVEFQEM